MKLRLSILLNALIPLVLLSVLLVVVLGLMRNTSGRLKNVANHEFAFAINVLSMVHELDVMHGSLMEYVNGNEDANRKYAQSREKLYQYNLALGKSATESEKLFMDSLTSLIAQSDRSAL
jgi:uncharacterized protein YgbK (DUF1537 family)